MVFIVMNRLLILDSLSGLVPHVTMTYFGYLSLSLETTKVSKTKSFNGYKPSSTDEH